MGAWVLPCPAAVWVWCHPCFWLGISLRCSFHILLCFLPELSVFQGWAGLGTSTHPCSRRHCEPGNSWELKIPGKDGPAHLLSISLPDPGAALGSEMRIWGWLLTGLRGCACSCLFPFHCLCKLLCYSVFQHGRLLGASGHEIPPHLRPADHSLQCLQDLGHRCLYLAPSLRSPGHDGQDQCLDSPEQRPV